MNFIHIAQNGYAALVTHDNGSSLTALQTLVDGYVDCVTADPDALGFAADVWVNDEGLYRKDFAINLVGSFITGRQLVGPIVIALSDADGETTGLTSAHIEQLRKDGLEIDDNGGIGWPVEQAAYFFGPEVASA